MSDVVRGGCHTGRGCLLTNVPRVDRHSTLTGTVLDGQTSLLGGWR